MIFQRLGARPASELVDKANVGELLRASMDFLRDSLTRGVFHGDCNLSNIFCADDFGGMTFIDFQLAVSRQCELGVALALQLATLRDWRLAPYISEAQYKATVFSYFAENFDRSPALEEMFVRFYKTKLSSLERRERLRLVCDGVDLLSAPD